jgi:hypothetical protein
MGSKRKKVIELFSAPKVYRQESVRERIEREKKRFEKANKERLQRLADARKRIGNKKDRD